jgi:transcriptional regulator with XRE-family HTH domain
LSGYLISMGWKQQLGAKLRRERESAGISLRGLGGLVKASPETIRQYERGRLPDADKLARIAVALGISEIELDHLRISIADIRTRTSQPIGEQLRLDFAGEYTRSKAIVKIRPGSVSVTVTGLRVGNVRS